MTVPFVIPLVIASSEGAWRSTGTALWIATALRA